MYHFQTTKYSIHKTLDEYSVKLADKIDKFFEVVQGLYGRNIISYETDKTIQISNMNHKNFLDKVDNFIKTIGLVELNINSAELLNIKDEIKADIYQLKYLLTFE